MPNNSERIKQLEAELELLKATDTGWSKDLYVNDRTEDSYFKLIKQNSAGYVDVFGDEYLADRILNLLNVEFS